MCSVEVVKTFGLMYGIVKVDFGEAVGLCHFVRQRLADTVDYIPSRVLRRL